MEELAAGLPQKDILLSLPAEGRICGCCGKPMKAIGKKFLKHELEDAVVYARNQKPHLNAFMEHGEVDVSSNTAENAIRSFVVGRKNWLFYDTPKGAKSGVIVYTLVESAKANGLEPGKYLETLLEDLRLVGRSSAHDRLSKLLPWAPGIRKSCTAAKKK